MFAPKQREHKTTESKGVGVGECLNLDDGELLSITEGMDLDSDSWFLYSGCMYHSVQVGICLKLVGCIIE